ncbi:MAG: glycosyltransferase [Halioglobus sp.]
MVRKIAELEPVSSDEEKPWVLISAYDLSNGQTSEGYVAFNLIRELRRDHRVLIVTRENNKKYLFDDDEFLEQCAGVHIVGYDLPKWARWWKSGARFYQIYAYLWQLTWPLAIKKHSLLISKVKLIHVLNFHNDSIPSLAWLLGPPVVWGPINHNEIVASWRRSFWPRSVSFRHVFAFTIRRAIWAFDPLLKMHSRRTRVIMSAGNWVNRRLGLPMGNGIIFRSQLGVDPAMFQVPTTKTIEGRSNIIELICAGRLDWIKGLDILIEAIACLPENYRLSIVGSGQAKEKLIALAKRLEVDERIAFEPSAPREKLNVRYKRCDLFVFTSAEVAGLVWVEALACGLPVVAINGESEVASAARQLPGIHLAEKKMFREEQAKSLAAAILVASDNVHRPSELRDAVLARYSWEKFADSVRLAYDTAITPSVS